MQLLVKDFAKELGCSDSIVYRHIRNHREELGDRIIKKAKQTWITEEGQEFIRGLMIQQPIVISEAGFAQSLEQLERENSVLKDKLITMHETLQAAQLQIEEGRRAQLALEASRVEKEALQTARDEYQAKAEQTALEAAQERQRAEEAEAEAQRLREELDRPLSFLERLRGRRKGE